jgi:hypothetical protein
MIRFSSFVILCSFSFGILLTGCTASTKHQIEREDFNTNNQTRTHDNSVQNDSPSRKAELNIEKIKNAKGSDQYNLLFSLTHIPIANDPIGLEPGSTLDLQVDGESMRFPTETGSREDARSPTLGIGKLETIRFQNIPLVTLKKITAAKDVRYELAGKYGKSTGRLTQENLAVFSRFLSTTPKK